MPPFKKKSLGVYPKDSRFFLKEGARKAKRKLWFLRATSSCSVPHPTYLCVFWGGRTDLIAAMFFYLVRTLGSFAPVPQQSKLGQGIGSELFPRRDALDRHATALLTLPTAGFPVSLLYITSKKKERQKS